MRDFKVVFVDPITKRVSFNPAAAPKTVAGIDKLIQIVVLALLNYPGRNVATPDKGSGLPSLIGTNINPSDPTEALADVTERIEKVREEILAAQNTLENEDRTERLADLQVLSVDTGVQIDEVIVKLRLISEAGDSTVVII